MSVSNEQLSTPVDSRSLAAYWVLGVTWPESKGVGVIDGPRDADVLEDLEGGYEADLGDVKPCADLSFLLNVTR